MESQRRTAEIRDHSEKITVGGCFEISPVKYGHPSLMINIIWVPPPRIGRIWVPPNIYVHLFFITPLHMFYGVIWAISLFLITIIWQNLAPPRKIDKIRVPHPDEWRNCPSPPPKPQQKLPPPGNIFWTVPNQAELGLYVTNRCVFFPYYNFILSSMSICFN